ncbi:MerR family transcriptional regulator [Alteromonas oceanisediminis]|uniref:MerR family transcriptional regulator n=1 Tax=Alteromonas oceanisediminis TaxID=2836180 RepID=UPI001BDB66BE|nr:MerR family transcriptional regulator [Alteromonas oceanisediminis]MBT0587944.1 MerR family transcriptional regulator [Alteromonas oceanisediminis]
MFIGDFCKLTSTTPKTIRFYEEQGLLPPARRQGSYRVYDDTYVETVRQIKLAQAHGFTLSELKEIFRGKDIRRGLPPLVILNAVKEKRQFIASEISRLNEIDKGLAVLQKKMKMSPCMLDSSLKDKV